MFNPPFSRNVTTNVAKTFLNLLDNHFLKSSKLPKMFNRNTVKVSYCCTENLFCIIRFHNKNVINEKKPTKVKCNFRNKRACPLDGNCEQNGVIYKCVASTSVNPYKVYLGTAEKSSKSYITTVISRSDTTVMLMKPLSLSTYGKSKINAMRCPS